jgi:hypothetical protein
MGRFCSDGLVKFSLPLACLAALALCACNTLENRRSLYSTQKVHGPYTRELEEGTWGNPKTVDEQYADTQAQKRYPKLIPGATKPAGGASTEPSYPDAGLPN